MALGLQAKRVMQLQKYLLLLFIILFSRWTPAQSLKRTTIKPDLLQAFPAQNISITRYQDFFYLTLSVPLSCVNQLAPLEIVYKNRLYLTLQAPSDCLQALVDFKITDLHQTTLQLQTDPSAEIYKFLYHSDSLIGYREVEIPLEKPLEANTCQSCKHSSSSASGKTDELKKIKNVLAKEAFEQFQRGNLKATKYFSILGQAILSDGLEYNRLIISDEYSPSYGIHTAHEKNKIDYKLFLDDKLGMQISLFNKPDAIIAHQNVSLGLKKDLMEKNSEEFFSKYSTKIDKNSFFEFTTLIEHNSKLFDKKMDVRYNLIF